MLSQVSLGIGSIDSVCLFGVKGLLDFSRVRLVIWSLVLLTLPVLHHHSNAGSATSVLLLLHEGDIQPETRRPSCDGKGARTEHQRHAFLNPAKPTPLHIHSTAP